MNDAESLDTALAQAGLPMVSHETKARLTRFVALLRDWQRVKNLVAPATLGAIWSRHVGDSAQLVALAPAARRWLDLGSGAGFPGVVTAILLAERPGTHVLLVESNIRKAAFLREAIRVTAAPAEIRTERIEDLIASWQGPLDSVSARAVAPLYQLGGWIEPLVARGAVAYLHKGADFENEVREASLRWTLDLIQHRSRFGPGVIVEVRGLARRSNREAIP